MNSENYIKVLFELEQDDDGYPPETIESMHAKPLGNNLYEIGNIPFYVRGVSMGDVILAEERYGALYYESVKSHSSNSTIRVIIFDEDKIDDIISRIKVYGTSIEGVGIQGLYSINVPANSNLEQLITLLARLEIEDALSYEEGALR